MESKTFVSINAEINIHLTVFFYIQLLVFLFNDKKLSSVSFKCEADFCQFSLFENQTRRSNSYYSFVQYILQLSQLYIFFLAGLRNAEGVAIGGEGLGCNSRIAEIRHSAANGSPPL